MLCYFLFLTEIYTILFVIFLLCFSALCVHYKYKDGYLKVTRFAVLLCIAMCSLFFLFLLSTPHVYVSFDLGLRFDSWSILSKFIIISFVWLYLVFICLNGDRYSFIHPDFIITFMFLFFSSFVLVSSNDFLIMFLSLDLQAICLFVLLAYNSRSMKSTEAAWKYFVLNGFASSLILLGICFFYFQLNTISFDDFNVFFSILSTFSADGGPIFGSVYLHLAILCFFLGFVIKIGLAPFHSWLVDVFEGTPEIVLPVLAVISKIAQFSIFFFIIIPFLNISDSLTYICLTIGLLSILFSAIQIVMQERVRRQIALLSIYSSGITFLFFANPFHYSSSFGFFYLFISSFFLYFYIYLCLVIVNISDNRILLENTYNFSLLSRNNFEFAILISFALVSLLGLPPLVGFFPKFFFLYCLSKVFFFGYVFFFLLNTLIFIFSFTYLIKEVFFVVGNNTGVNTLCTAPLSFANTVSLFLLVVVGIYLLFFGSTYMLDFVFSSIAI